VPLPFAFLASWFLNQFLPVSDKPATSQPSHTARNTGIGIAVALLLYVLSTGPVVRLTVQGKISWETIQIIYAPLVWLVEHDRTLSGPFLECYTDLWIKDLNDLKLKL